MSPSGRYLGRIKQCLLCAGVPRNVSTVLPVPLTESSSRKTSMADILGLTTLIVTVPAVVVAVIVLVRYFRQRGRRGQAHQHVTHRRRERDNIEDFTTLEDLVQGQNSQAFDNNEYFGTYVQAPARTFHPSWTDVMIDRRRNSSQTNLPEHDVSHIDDLVNHVRNDAEERRSDILDAEQRD